MSLGCDFQGRGGTRPLDVRHEAIPLARNRLDEGRRADRIAESLANLADRRMDARLDIDEHVLAPQPLDNIGAGDEVPRRSTSRIKTSIGCRSRRTGRPCRRNW